MVKKVECTFARLTFLKTGGSQFESFISMISREKPSYLSLSTPSQSRENTSKHGLILQLCAFGFDLSCISMMISYDSKQNNVIFRVLLINQDINGRLAGHAEYKCKCNI